MEITKGLSSKMLKKQILPQQHLEGSILEQNLQGNILDSKMLNFRYWEGNLGPEKILLLLRHVYQELHLGNVTFL